MEYKELIKNRRSIRVYQDKAIPDYVIKEILSEACLAPSSSNKQPWKFLVVTNRNLIKKLSEESKKNILVDISKNPTSIYKQYENFFKKPDANIFYNAPCIIFIVGTNNYRWFYQDCSLCAAYLMFAATARNLGTCWIGFAESMQDENLRREIGLAVGVDIAAAIILGYPLIVSKPNTRRPPEVLYYDIPDSLSG